MGLFDKVARILHENTEDTKNVAADTNTAKKAEPASPPLDSEARTAYEQGFDCYRKGEYEEAARLYRISADLGFFRAQYSLALLYSEGCGVEKNLAEAEKWAQKAADQGYEAAAKLVKEIQEKRSATSDALALGVNFYEQEDYEQAVHHFRTAANQGNTNAQLSLAVCYATGKGVEKDLDTAELWARQALDSGDEQAAELLDAIHEEQRDEAFELGVSCYEQGDYTQAFHWYHEAAEQGDQKAIEALEKLRKKEADEAFFLGVACYEKGHYTQAVQHFRTAAEQGIAEAQFNLALCYEHGKGVEQDQAEAIRWYRAAAEQGDAKAQFSLAGFYFEGNGVEKSWEKALLWTKRAHEHGYDLAAQLLEEFEELKTSAYEAGGAQLKGGDSTQAAQYFRDAAELGHVEAQFLLALCYEIGTGVEESAAEAFYWYSKAAEQGHTSAQFNLAICYEKGRGVEQNQQEAICWYRKSAEQGNQNAASALFTLGVTCYEKGDYTQAVQHFHTAAELGVAEAQYNLAICYARGEGVEKDLDTAITWAERAHEQGIEAADELSFKLRLEREAAKPHFLIAAERGDANAQFALALRYADGDGVEQDQSKAVHWYQKAAEQGHAKAQFNLAVRYENGNGIERDQTKAVRWYLKAAQQGHSGAQLNLALCYRDGDGVQEDQWKASHWFHMAAEQGDAVAQFNLAVRYEEGRGIHQNQSEAIRWYRTAAHHGYANAQNNLAICYEQGRGVKQDQREAVRWYRAAAEQGYASAQFNLALCYINGDGVEPNMPEAIHWYIKAAEQGHTTAQFNLAVRYENGNGVEKNQSEAVRWYRAAAEQGYASAQYNLSICYRDGDGVAVDLDTAELWAQKAAEQGYESAPKLLEGIRQRKNSR